MEDNAIQKGALPFREGLFSLATPDSDGSYLIASECENCGQIHFPRRTVCIACLGTVIREHPLSTRGTVYSFTIARMMPPGFPVPCVLSYVDLDEGVRVAAHLVGREPEQWRIGMDVEMVFGVVRHDREGRGLIGYQFRPVGGVQ